MRHVQANCLFFTLPVRPHWKKLLYHSNFLVQLLAKKKIRVTYKLLTQAHFSFSYLSQQARRYDLALKTIKLSTKTNF